MGMIRIPGCRRHQLESGATLRMPQSAAPSLHGQLSNVSDQSDGFPKKGKKVRTENLDQAT